MEKNQLSIDDLALWPHQKAATDAAEAYFASGSSRGCLVHMPTGSGKTGIIATIASLRSLDKAVLVVCPSAALVEQLTLQFRRKFWEKIGANDVWKPDQVLNVLPSKIDETAEYLKENPDERIFLVSTVQAVQQADAEGNIAKLHEHVGTILFDEGHREPATSWARVVRGFNVPVVLFSATPFRGDFKIFDVDEAHIHSLAFVDAVEQGLVRDVEVDEQDLPKDRNAFASDLVKRVDQLIDSGHLSTTNKIIVRCASEESVTEMHQALSAALDGRDDGVLAIHDNFKTRPEAGLWASVPGELHARTERFLIHQFKLIEGVDDPNCRMLALFEPFSNTRMLVQQVGRLIRHPGPLGTEVGQAYVLAPSGSNVRKDWQGFLAYDLASKEEEKPIVRNDARILHDLIAALPKLDYISGKFRERPDLDASDLHDDLRFPSSAVAFMVDPELDMDSLQNDIAAELDNNDRHEALRGKTKDGECRYHITLGLTQSPFLSDTLFQAPSLEATIYAKQGGRLFFYDSAGLWINDVEGVGPRLNSRVLRALLPDGHDNSVSFLNVKNTDLGPLALRSRSLSARSLDRSGVFLGEHLNVVTRAAGHIRKAEEENRISRAVGFSRSRVRDGKGAELTAQGYADWCGRINAELDAETETASIFSRFAIPSETPDDTTPINILIDMLEVGGQFVSSHDGTTVVETEDLCVGIEEDNSAEALGRFRFTLRVDGVEHQVWIDWVPKKRKYWLVSPGLSRIKSKDNPKITLTKRLNQLQPFRIITSGLNYSYVGGDFYRLDLNLKDPGGPASLVLDLLTPVAGMADVTSEKGELVSGLVEQWSDGSLFALIDRALRPDQGPAILGTPFPNLVCDDLQNEVGDFIGVDETSPKARVALIVGKWKGGNPGVSASAFYDVCAQGVKNLAYMKSDGAELPGSSTRFDGKWRLSRSGNTQTVERKRHGRGSRAFRAAFQRLRTAPTTDRSIWLVCSGGMLSLSKLKSEFAKTEPEPHVLQFYHLVLATYSACQSVGVQLRILCAE